MKQHIKILKKILNRSWSADFLYSFYIVWHNMVSMTTYKMGKSFRLRKYYASDERQSFWLKTANQNERNQFWRSTIFPYSVLWNLRESGDLLLSNNQEVREASCKTRGRASGWMIHYNKEQKAKGHKRIHLKGQEQYLINGWSEEKFA